MTAFEWDLLDKTEIRIEPIGLDDVNLTDAAAAVADALGLPATDVVVIDAPGDVLALDILRATVDPHRLTAKQHNVLEALGRVPGVTVNDRTQVGSQGILGWIAAEPHGISETLDRARTIAATIERTIATRALVLSTGNEVLTGHIEDTNKPWIAARLRQAGFTAVEGPTLPDDLLTIAAAVREAGEELGYGLIITTGGVGAEGKDTTVEALLALDPAAATPPLFTVTPGHGRHRKGEIRIGVGRVGTATVVCLPGPHAEATLGIQALVDELPDTTDTGTLARRIADVLRARLRGQR
ncbi:molybdopterin-binding protein [Nocardia vinacea]|uniref:Molybdopterin-binding protein n=1 Tax=Nocardia vinacea TaxID=96468 RepID=A0ABZ1YTW4_9NOCA|nr:molybdopterin-binding protein [Nocardia vinacea]